MTAAIPDPDQSQPHVAVDNDLVARCLDGLGTAADVSRLEARLAADPAFRDRWLELATIDALLAQRIREETTRDVAWSLPAEPPTDARSLQTVSRDATPAARRFARWLPFVAGAVGLAVGGLFATAVWAMVAPHAPTVIRILAESFESGDQPGVTGLPDRTGIWSGDYVDLVPAQSGVSPASGSRMLRFLRADFEGKPMEDGFACNTLRLIDLWPYRRQIAGGTLVAQISAVFNTQADAGDQRDQAGVAAAALDASMALDGSMRTGIDLPRRSLAYASCKHVDLDRDADTWQEGVVELRLPPQTEFLLVNVGVNELPAISPGKPAVFAGHYCDDIRVSLVERPRMP